MDRRSYILEAERFFAIMRMGGFALSHDDLAQVEDAFRKGLPLEVLLAGLSEGVRAFLHNAGPGTRPPRRLAAYRKFIKSHITSFRPVAGGAGGGPTTAPSRRDLPTELARLEFLALCEERPLEQAVKAQWLTRLQELGQGTASEAPLDGALGALDCEMLDFYHRRLVETGALPAQSRPSDEDLRRRLQVPNP